MFFFEKFELKFRLRDASHGVRVTSARAHLPLYDLLQITYLALPPRWVGCPHLFQHPYYSTGFARCQEFFQTFFIF